ncbi:ZWICHEL kinesin-like calmodulin-binding protein, partial [Prunus dulcis]
SLSSLSLSLLRTRNPLPFYFFWLATATTSHHRHRHHTPPLGAAPVPLEPPHFLLSVPTHRHLDPPSWSPETATKRSCFDSFHPTFGLSFSLISPPHLTSKVLRPRIHSRRDPLTICSVIALARVDL